MSNGIVRTWTFRSGSNPNKVYEAILYADGNTSCNCPGWTRRCQGGVRTCKHVRMVETDTADRNAEAVWSSLDQNRLREEENRRAEKIVDRDDNQTRKEANTRKLARIAERVKKEGMEVFPTKRKVNW